MTTAPQFSTTHIGRDKADDLQDERARLWLEQHMGGKVLSMARRNTDRC